MNVRTLISPIIQRAASRKRSRTLLLAVCAVVLLNTIVGVYFMVSVPDTPSVKSYVAPPVHVSAPSVSSGSIPPPPTRSWRMKVQKPNVPLHCTNVSPWAPSSSASWRVKESSAARVHSYGSGGGTSSGSQNSSSKRGISTQTVSVAPITNFVALRASQPMAEAGASQAPEMATMATAPSMRRAPGPPVISNPPEDHQLVEHPIGANTGVLLLFASLYGLLLFFRRKRKIA